MSLIVMFDVGVLRYLSIYVLCVLRGAIHWFGIELGS